MPKSKFDQNSLFAQGLRGCNSCMVIKSIDEFTRNKSKNNGLESSCKECVYNRNQHYLNSNKDNILSHKREYYLAHKEEKREYDKKYRFENKEIKAKKDHDYRLKNLEKIKARKKIKNDWLTHNCDDQYIKRLVIQTGLTNQDIALIPQIIELKRIEIQNIRIAKQLKKEESCQKN